MGTTLNNIHIFVEAVPIEEAVESLRQAVQDAMQQHGYQPISLDQAQHTIRLLYENGSFWLSVCQENSLQTPPDMAVLLSQSGYPVLEVWVFDSDVLQMRLLRNGQIIDTFNDWANYDESPPKRIGHAALWPAHLSMLCSTQALREAWTPSAADVPFESEGILYRVMELLMIPRWRLWNCRSSVEIPEQGEVSELYFRHTLPHPYDLLAEGLPAFRMTSYPLGVDAKIDRNFDVVFAVMNLGGESVGVQVVLEGNALEVIEPVGIIVEPPFNWFSGRIAARPEKHVSPDGTLAFSFNLKDRVILAGPADWKSVYDMPLHLRDFKKEFEVQTTRGMVSIVFKPMRTGKGQLILRVAPLANPDASASFTADIDIA